jgi:hypothetical protein
VFRIAHGRTAEVARQLLGEQYANVATCDRLKSYWWIKRLRGRSRVWPCPTWVLE